MLNHPALRMAPPATREPDNVVFHVELPWLLIVTEVYPGYDLINFHYDTDVCEVEDFDLAASFLRPGDVRLHSTSSACLPPTPAVRNELMVTYRQSTS